MWIRPKRINGNAGIWAREYSSGWTIFSFAGIVAQGLTEEKVTEQLKILELKVVPMSTSGKVKGETYAVREDSDGSK